MKLFTINGVQIKALAKLKMAKMKRGFVKHWSEFITGSLFLGVGAAKKN